MVTADAWVNDVLGHLGLHLPVEVTLEQVTYFAARAPRRVRAGLPLWIWMDDPSFYGFPTYGEPTVKIAQDCGGPVVDPDDRTSDPDPEMLARLSRHVRALLPGVGEPLRSVRCQYTLTPDRDFVIAPVPGHERVVVGLGRGARVQVRADVRPAARRPGHHRRDRRPTCRRTGWTGRP